MSLTAKSKEGYYDVPDAGNQPAVIVAIVDLGTQQNEYKGESWESRKILIVWELVDREISDKINHVIGREYTLSLSKNSHLGTLVSSLTSRKFVEGDEFDISKLLGMKCLVNVVHGESKKGNTYARVENASAISKGKTGKPLIEVSPPKYKPVLWEIEDNDKLPHELDWLPYIMGEKVTNVISRSKEWREKFRPANGRKDAQSQFGENLASENDEEIAF